MYLNMNVIYSVLIIIASLFIPYALIKDFKNGRYEPSIWGNNSCSPLFRFLNFIVIFSLLSLSNSLIKKITFIIFVLTCVIVTNVLNYKCYSVKREKRIITATVIFDILAIALMMLISFAKR